MTWLRSAAISRRKLAIPAILGVVVLTAGTFGAYRGLRSSPGDTPINVGAGGGVGASQNDTVVGRPFIQLSQRADPAISFLTDLTSLGVNPQRMALDPGSAAIWFADVPGAGKSDRLFRYDTSGALRSFDVPGSLGTPLGSSIAIDGRGHVILAEGAEVIDLDPATGDHRQYQIPQSSFAAPFITEPSAYPGINQIAVGAGNRAYISRINTAAITELDLLGGTMKEIPYPVSFGQVDRLAAADGNLWITNPTTNVNGTQPQTGVIDLATGQYTPVGRVVTGFADRAEQGTLYAMDPNTGIVALDGKQVTEAPSLKVGPQHPGDAYLGFGSNDQMAVDPQRGVLWLASNLRTDIVRMDTSTGAVTTYDLPVYLTTSYTCPDESFMNGCKDPVEARSRVGGMAVDAKGDLYFLEEAFSRIGVIRSP